MSEIIGTTQTGIISPDLVALRDLVTAYNIQSNAEGFAICYGSAARTGSSSADLDMMIVEQQPQPDQARQIFIESLIRLHKRSGRVIDTEVPYENKIFYSINELGQSFGHAMFTFGDKFDVPTLEAIDESYFASQDMKLRLCLNALTSSHVLLAGSESMYRVAQSRAERSLGQLAHRLCDSDDRLDVLAAQDLLVTAPNGAAGQDYLGYVRRDTVFRSCLERALNFVEAVSLGEEVPEAP